MPSAAAQETIAPTHTAITAEGMNNATKAIKGTPHFIGGRLAPGKIGSCMLVEFCGPVQASCSAAATT